MTNPSQQVPMLASACASIGGTTLTLSARTLAGVSAAQTISGAGLVKTRTTGHVIGAVSPVAAQQPQSVPSPEQIQVQDPRGGYAHKPEFTSTKVDGLRGVPPRGRPV